MDPAVGGDYVADLVDLEGVRRILEGLLHLALQSIAYVSIGELKDSLEKTSRRTCLKKPRSPPLECELQSLCKVASSENFWAEPPISSR